MSQTVDRIISIFKAMSRVERSNSLRPLQQTQTLKLRSKHSRQNPPQPPAAEEKDGSRRRLSRLGGSSLSRESATRMPVARS